MFHAGAAVRISKFQSYAHTQHVHYSMPLSEILFTKWLLVRQEVGKWLGYIKGANPVLNAQSCVSITVCTSSFAHSATPPSFAYVSNPAPDSSLCRAAAPRSCPLQLLLPDCACFDWCSLIASACSPSCSSPFPKFCASILYQAASSVKRHACKSSLMMMVGFL